MGYSTDHTSDCYHFWNPVKNGVIETCDAIFLYQMYFSRNDHTPMLQVEPEDEIVDAWDLLAKDEGSDSDDEWEPPTTKSVTFADAVDTTVKSASADQAPFFGPSTDVQSAPLSASQPQTILTSGRLSTPPYYFKPETNLAQHIMSQTETSVAEANYLAHMLELDNTELSANQIAWMTHCLLSIFLLFIKRWRPILVILLSLWVSVPVPVAVLDTLTNFGH
jgi:hypothetical protein